MRSAAIYSLTLDGSNSMQRTIDSKLNIFPLSWSLDGKWLAYDQRVTDIRQIFIHSVLDSKLDSGKPRQLSPPTFVQTHAEFSPDVHWIAYRSEDSGRSEVYVQPFPGPGPRRQVSVKGGTSPAWSRNGRELFYLAPRTNGSYAMMAVDFSTTGEPSSPRLLFEGPYNNTTPLRS
jgi:Tol biopolymer transport system component